MVIRTTRLPKRPRVSVAESTLILAISVIKMSLPEDERPGAFEILRAIQDGIVTDIREPLDVPVGLPIEVDHLQQTPCSTEESVAGTCADSNTDAHAEDNATDTDTTDDADSDPDFNVADEEQVTVESDDDHEGIDNPGTSAGVGTPGGEPAEVIRARKRKRSVESWKKNRRREDRVRGRQYTSTTGQQVEAKKPQPACAASCRRKCTTIFTEEDRKQLCKSYYDLANYARQKDYICCNIVEQMPKQRVGRNPNKRNVSRSYSFPKGDRYEQVCQRFFMSTLDISESVIRHALKHKGSSGTFTSLDQRGKHSPANKTPALQIEGVRMHIRSIPSMESHYTRKDTQRKYLDSGLSIRKMHRDLYPAWCQKHGYAPVSEKVYRTIFNTEFNLGFHQPKKDRCLACTKFENLTGDAKEEFRPNHEEHLLRKEESATMKDADKTASANDPNLQAITFDLQAVLQTPFTDVGLLYYKRKLSVYNFTIYEQDTRKGYCYLWPESEGKRGANEIASCLLSYLRSLPPNIHHVTSFSDTCTGQNRNVHVAAALVWKLILCTLRLNVRKNTESLQHP
ncbi:hypothetical protein HOLleu_10703 [Holothuria leucospilota]|uniref:Uncharacterized protein n=1 Tax=Holothuria leucospilota TaxID=206669 RepID=A0A9Q1HEP1_HOLLE|nr:hypothetical protein HOLleu_10703 [Holothuria leucospilota]